jgi:serine/threonine-protein kinase
MERLRGESLEALLHREGRLDRDQSLDLIEQVLLVLDQAHRVGVVHRDIKPANLYLRTDGTVVLLDFGVARALQDSPATLKTGAASLLGTPAYMSPEQARADWEKVDGRSDLFSIAATLFTLLTGQFVHEGRTQNEQLGLAMTAAARPLAEVEPSVPPAVAAVVDRALAFNP